MKVTDLVSSLLKLPLDAEVMILDGYNGGGFKRAINFGPTRKTVTQGDVAESSDCEDLEGESVVVIGFGCY